MIDSPDAADRQALILLCAWTRTGSGSAPPFGPVAWATLNATLVTGEKRLGDLLGLGAAEIRTQFEFTEDQATRIAALLSRGGPMAIELDRLANRGIWVTTLLDETYPPKLRDRLGDKAPPLLFGAGEGTIAGRGGLAIIGSRDADENALEFAADVAQAAARGGLTVVSGAARGVDAAAMHGALDHGGSVVGVLADALERRIREPQVRSWMADGQLCLLTPYAPDSGFSVGAAMGRNKLIYAASDAALVVSASEGTGGTWSGAIEALKGRWTPVFVRQGDDLPPGNRRLVERGAHAFPLPSPESLSLADLVTTNAESTPPAELAESVQPHPMQETLFGAPEAVALGQEGKGRRHSAQRGRREE